MLYTDQAHILVVDDDDRIRDLLRRYLSGQGYLVSTAENAEKARDILRVSTYDLIVLDVMMPGETGFELCSYITQAMDVPVILLTAKGEVADRVEGLTRGADDYLPKPFEPKELVLRVEAILRRTKPQQTRAQDIQRIGDWVFDAIANTLAAEDETIRLTEGEVALLSALMQKRGSPIPRDVLAKAVGLEGADRAIDVQMSRLRRKMGDDPKAPRWIQTLRGRGYLLREEGA